jgi:hypothetical protein
LEFDTIFHVVRMGRLEENDKKLPRLVFETLMTPKSDREELLKRYRLLVTHCDSSDDDGISAVEAMAQFRGQLIETLPEKSSVTLTLFSLKIMPGASQTITMPGAFVARLYMATWYLAVRIGRLFTFPRVCPTSWKMRQISYGRRWNGPWDVQLSASLTLQMYFTSVATRAFFFRFVVKSGKWQEPRGTGLPADFVQAWKALHIAGRDRIGVEFAEHCLPILTEEQAPAAQCTTRLCIRPIGPDGLGVPAELT